MSPDENFYRILDKSYVSKVTIGNEESLHVKGKGLVAVETITGTKLISNVLLVPEIS